MTNNLTLIALCAMIFAAQAIQASHMLICEESNFNTKDNDQITNQQSIEITPQQLDEWLAQQLIEYTFAMNQAKTQQEKQHLVAKVLVLTHKNPAFANPINKKITKQAIEASRYSNSLKDIGIASLDRFTSSSYTTSKTSQSSKK